MRKAAIYIAVIVTMIASIFVAGFIGPIVVSLVLETMARRQKKQQMFN